VDAIVEGSVMREGSRIRVHAQLIRGPTDEHFWSESYDRELGDALALEGEVAQAIAGRVEVTITGVERTRLVAARQVPPEVCESYLKGQFTSCNSPATIFCDGSKSIPSLIPSATTLALRTWFAGSGLTSLINQPASQQQSTNGSGMSVRLPRRSVEGKAPVVLAGAEEVVSFTPAITGMA
jgi:hypothetical protein